jgi:hypothetical protein
VGSEGFAASDTLAPAGHPMNIDDFADVLTANPWSRLLHLGHIAAGRDDDPAAALVFQHNGLLPRFTANLWLSEPQRWPAPELVALIGCGSDDARFLEASGLPVAAVNAGAQLVTAPDGRFPRTAGSAPVDRPRPSRLPPIEPIRRRDPLPLSGRGN